MSKASPYCHRCGRYSSDHENRLCLQQARTKNKYDLPPDTITVQVPVFAVAFRHLVDLMFKDLPPMLTIERILPIRGPAKHCGVVRWGTFIQNGGHITVAHIEFCHHNVSITEEDIGDALCWTAFSAPGLFQAFMNNPKGRTTSLLARLVLDACLLSRPEDPSR